MTASAQAAQATPAQPAVVKPIAEHTRAARALSRRRAFLKAKADWLAHLSGEGMAPMRELVSTAWAGWTPDRENLGRASQGHREPFYVAREGRVCYVSYPYLSEPVFTPLSAAQVERTLDLTLDRARKALSMYGPTGRCLNDAVATYVDLARALAAALRSAGAVS